MITVDIEIGSKIKTRVPSNQYLGYFYMSGTVTKITRDAVYFETASGNIYITKKYRIFEFTFGGISIRNAKYDKKRCDDE